MKSDRKMDRHKKERKSATEQKKYLSFKDDIYLKNQGIIVFC